MIRIKKMKFTKTGRVSIEYEKYNNKASSWDEYSMTCIDMPRPELQETLQALSIHVTDMCELPQEYKDRIEVSGVTFSYGGENEVMGAVIVSQMKLENANCNLNLNTPHKASESYNDYDADPKQLLSEDCIDDLDKFCKEIELYIDGERAQTTMFAVQ